MRAILRVVWPPGRMAVTVLSCVDERAQVLYFPTCTFHGTGLLRTFRVGRLKSYTLEHYTQQVPETLRAPAFKRVRFISPVTGFQTERYCELASGLAGRLADGT